MLKTNTPSIGDLYTAGGELIKTHSRWPILFSWLLPAILSIISMSSQLLVIKIGVAVVILVFLPTMIAGSYWVALEMIKSKDHPISFFTCFGAMQLYWRFLLMTILVYLMILSLYLIAIILFVIANLIIPTPLAGMIAFGYLLIVMLLFMPIWFNIILIVFDQNRSAWQSLKAGFSLTTQNYSYFLKLFFVNFGLILAGIITIIGWIWLAPRAFMLLTLGYRAKAQTNA